MKLYCKTCHVVLTQELTELYDLDQLCVRDEYDYIPIGKYIYENKEEPSKPEKQIIVNLKDLVNVKRHSDTTRLSGCCHLDGLNGINVVCTNDHEIGIESSDCWMPCYFTFEADLVEWED